MNKNLLVGVDEFSLVLFPPFPVEVKDWIKSAYIMMYEFLNLSRIEFLFGEVTEMFDKKPSAYSQAFTIDGVPWYFAIAIHDTFQHMGVLVKFSAQAWSTYQQAYFEAFNKKVNIASFFKMIESEVVYTYRLSRIDFTADFFNYDITPDYIYRNLSNQSYHVEDHNGRKTNRKLSAMQTDMVTQSFYVGSRKENSQLLMRVYDKKLEQISQNGFRLEEALNCDSWVRFEASYRGKYAHQITEQILNDVTNEIELSQFIASKICDKYRFVNSSTGQYTEFTNDLLYVMENSNYPALRCENPKNNSLNKAISHIIKGSGLYPLLFKIGKIWGEQSEVEFLDIIYKIYKTEYEKEMERNPTIISWLRKNYSSLVNQKLTDCFMGENLSKDVSKLIEQPKDIFNLKEVKDNKLNTIPNADEEISDEEFNRLLNM